MFFFLFIYLMPSKKIAAILSYFDWWENVVEVKRFSLASRIVLALNSISAAAILSAMSEQLLSKQNTEWFLDFLNLKQLLYRFSNNFGTR